MSSWLGSTSPDATEDTTDIGCPITIVPLQALAAEARGLERRVAELVNAAYGLTPEEVALMWKTAPPRMPGAPRGMTSHRPNKAEATKRTVAPS